MTSTCQPTETANGKFRYWIKDCRKSSAELGPCEVCSTHVSDVFWQSEERRCCDTNGEFWSKHDCHDLFGHEACLVGARHG